MDWHKIAFFAWGIIASAIVVLAITVWITTPTRRVIKSIDKIDESFEEWVGGITNMETNYEKILKEAVR